MNTITEPRHAVSSSKVLEPTEAGPKGPQPKAGLGELWLAILALVVIVGLGVAVAVGAFDSSSDNATTTVVDPRADADSHREVPAPKQGMDSDVYRELNRAASQAPIADATVDPRLDADSHREPSANQGLDSDVYRETNQHASQAPATQGYVNSGLDPETQQAIYEASQADDSVDPRADADHHREASNG